MKKQRRGDEKAEATPPANEQQEPVTEQPAEGQETEQPGTEGVAAEPAPAEPEPTAEDLAKAEKTATFGMSRGIASLGIAREFRRHARTGEIVAVELVGGMLQGARLCSKPEEQTHGALPVMELENRESDVAQWYRKNSLEFKAWEPPQPPRLLMDKLMSLYEESQAARDTEVLLRSKHKNAKAAVEDVDERIFLLLKRIHDTPEAQQELPLADADDVKLPLAGEALDPAEEKAGDSSIEDGEVIDAEVTGDDPPPHDFSAAQFDADNADEETLADEPSEPQGGVEDDSE